MSGHQQHKDWLEMAGRVGRFAKGGVYCLTGVLALLSAIGSGEGQVGGSKDAVGYLEGQPMGEVLLWITAVGLAGYALWRLAVGILDVEGKGTEPKQVAVRIGLTCSGLLHAGLALTAAQLALGSGGGDDGGAQAWTARALETTGGQIIVGAIGAIVIGVGLYQFARAASEKFMERLKTHEMTQTVRQSMRRLGQIGYAARGIVFPIIGFGAVKAAWNHSPGQAKGLGDALQSISSSTYGQILLGVVAFGLAAYGVFMIASAKYHRMPMS